ncbi:endonuclease/exonuclease/phosphatase family metal-dependent hydrolase [Hephaestia caeni]|uniref:Endonuclease/exonuclease/phosphatase family metal-dependent hydrolase n=1 Tax=Hephaestia caeni TaxID=645617 RepID=A0A397PAU7_9SPHN|nr:endonuclease/exonuclease/phosphatase family protein [Hephaestia caeni]RIA45513.1 endonuclease/exonuclease/phosphatase family metal-dependent hydrolase [Hephaestia caeni]
MTAGFPRWAFKTMVVGLAVLLAGCASLPPPRLAPVAGAAGPVIVTAADGEHRTTLTVLTFNIEGLGWPARKGRGPSLQRISAVLGEMAAQGHAPDIILIQEMFSPAAVRAVETMPYANAVFGPSRTQKPALSVAGRMGGPFVRGKGEIGIHLVPSGLAILSRYPIVASRSEPFGSRRCAGIDCLSNKGVLHARIHIPGVPQPVDLFNTHMNSQGASGVSPQRHRAAHHLQTAVLSDFIDRVAHRDMPLILGGDFNMRHDQLRFLRFRQSQPLALVHQYCVEQPARCDVRMSWDGDEPWMDTQDLQLFDSGAAVSITPIRVESLFDGSPDSPRLSDHDGFLVTYRLNWR